MARPQLALGECGEVTITPVEPLGGGRYKALAPRARSSHYRASAYVRLQDGRRVEVRRVAGSRAQAKQDVEDAVRERLNRDAGAGDRITSRTPIVEACRAWLGRNTGDGGRLAPRTGEVYGHTFERVIAAKDSAISGLTLAEANDAQRLRHFLETVAKAHGAGTAKHAKAILSGTLKDAVSMRVLPTNELRQVDGVVKVERKRGADRDTSRAFTEAELTAVLALADSRLDDDNLIRRSRLHLEAVADLVWFLAGTGVRIGEALDVRWEHLDLATGEARIPGTKTRAALRTITLPTWLVKRLTARSERVGTDGLVFASPAAGEPLSRWDTSNATKAVSGLLKDAGVPWASSHSFRRTVATRLFEAGAGPHRVADWLGQSDPGVTMRHYLGRDPRGPKADLAEMLTLQSTKVSTKVDDVE